MNCESMKQRHRRQSKEIVGHLLPKTTFAMVLNLWKYMTEHFAKTSHKLLVILDSQSQHN